MVEKQMKTFNVGDTRYIVTDAEAREDIAELQDAMSPLDVSAENEDVGKALKAKTVSGGKVTEYELGYAAIIDDTLSVAGEAADAKETGDAIADLDAAKVNKPTTSPNGTSGQLLRTNGDGTTTWVDQGLPTDEQTADAVEAWLDAHPEATTTVQDGAITKAKLDSNLQNTVDDVADLKSQINQLDNAVGDTPMGTTADTITGAVAEHEGDITALSAGLSAEASRASAAESLKVNKPTISPNGTSGQLLRTNGDGTTTWVDEGLPTDEQTAEAVGAWLDDHPEATTTVQDGAITKAKLDSNLQGTVDDVDVLKSHITPIEDNALIIDDTAKAYYHNVAPKSATFYQGTVAQGVTAGYVGSPMLLPYGSYTSGTDGTSGVTRTPDGRFQKLSGTGSGSGNVIVYSAGYTGNDCPINGKTVNVCVYIKKATNWQNEGSINVLVNYEGHTNVSIKKVTFSASSSDCIGWTVMQNIEIPSVITMFRIRIDGGGKQTFSDGDYFWFGVYEASPVISESAVSTDPVTINNISGLTYIDTMMHESTIKTIVPTKEYVDSHIPDIVGYWSDNIYALPEDFGAAGDGETDDTAAIADCIAYAKISGKAVRGYKHYKITSTVALDVRYLDIYLRTIDYTGNGAAISVQNSDIVFGFHEITSEGIGISFDQLPSGARAASRCQVTGNSINSESHCIELKDATYYSTVDIRKLSSTSGDCIHRTHNGSNGGAEFVFRSSTCQCPNGYVTYNVNSCKFYDFTIESGCRFGLLNPQSCVCVGFRHREQIDLIRRRVENGDENNGGSLIIFTESPNADGRYGFKYIASDPLLWYSIDVSAVSGYDDESDYSEWIKMAYNGVDLGTPIRTNTWPLGSGMYFIGNNKVYVPEGRLEVSINTATVNLALIDSNTDADITSANSLVKYMGTDFIIDVAHADISLNASYGAIGYNDITVTQTDGNTCTIYDKLGNVLFDGTNEGDGKWSMKCIVDRSSKGRYTEYTTAWVYDGTNEKWEITKFE